MYGAGRLVLILLALALATVAGWRLAIRWHPSVAKYPVQGIDVSEANGAVEWAVAKGAGVDFGYAVATRGHNVRDRTFQAHWDAMAAAGVRRGAIHVYSFCQDGAEQANAFNTVVPLAPDALPAAIDLHYDPACPARPDRAALIADVAEAARRIEAHTGKPVLLKVAPDVEDDYTLVQALRRNIWATGNFLRPAYTDRPWRMWQASDIRRVDGVEGPVNWDVAVR
ncbi:glycosyl hydrolase [Sphingomonas sp. Leaf412]|uniref:GH25 family lysozyme n=1 Tax=Sphingomonas sp. Leaf412 TaxID=1736370 RepID=UPI0006F7DCB1|nr:GH25 family lysozyme [Sphingomonas sp. Leaf412]KQT32278.1 glycosyl hydrolase [Sphingomonas sp. Leaf412]